MSPFQPATGNVNSSWKQASTLSAIRDTKPTYTPRVPIPATATVTVNKPHLQDRIAELSQGLEGLNIQSNQPRPQKPHRQTTSIAPDVHTWNNHTMHTSKKHNPDLVRSRAGLNPYTTFRPTRHNHDMSTAPWTLPEWAQPTNVPMRAVEDEIMFAPRGAGAKTYDTPKPGFGYGGGSAGCRDVPMPRWVGCGGGDERVFDARRWA
ncbi:uncharacterized protein BDV14DRAFT_202963 [Aspergillus stella-maris]|uniref:uncharacterized protein n=1 Tax=Aspergillus stella-maris TaxID=1810926 RepID=UPI003CCDC8D8